MPHINTRAVASLLFVELFIFFNMDMFLSGFPIYVTMMGASEDLMGLLFGVFMLSGMIFRPLFARLGQRFGQKLVLGIGAAVCLIAPWLYLVTNSFLGLVFVRAFHGLVPGTFITATQLLLMQECGEERKAVGVGLFGIMGGISMMMMPYLGVHLLTEYGPLIWLAAASLYGAIALGIFWFLVRGKVDDVEVVRGRPQPLPLRLIAVPLVCNVLLALGFGSVLTYVSTYALSLGYNNPGQFFSVLSVMTITTRALLAFFGDRLPQRLVIIPAVASFSLGLYLLAFPPSPGWIIASAVPLGLGFFTAVGVMMLNVANAVPGVQRSMATAFLVNSVDLGLAVASIALGVVVANWSYQVLYSLGLACALAALLLIITSLREREVPQETASDTIGKETPVFSGE